MRPLAMVVTLLAISLVVAAEEAKTLRTEHVVVAYSGVGEAYPKAIARIVEAARAAAEESGFDMPNVINVQINADPKAAVRLFNDGKDRFVLTIRTERDLRKPAESGVFHIYGLCHEVGHLAMYRVIRDHSWMTTAGAEGWAHYFGSQVVDKVHADLGKDGWPDAYDYLADGTRRLEQQLAAPRPAPTTQGAGQWKALAGIVGDKDIAPIFAAWGKAEIDPADPAPALRKAMLAVKDDKSLAEWWSKSEQLMIFKRPKSGFAAKTADAKDLTNRPVELALDDGKPAGHSSVAGSGHAVRLKTEGDGWCVTAVRVYGSRYGRSQPSDRFSIWLCDKDFRTVAEYKFPFSSFTFGQEKWVTLPIMPTLVPAEFIVCVGFNPTATNGVYVSYDGQRSTTSLHGLPGTQGGAFSKGNWMIRAVTDQLKSADALREGKPR